jgi:hypothetical protein
MIYSDMISTFVELQRSANNAESTMHGTSYYEGFNDFLYLIFLFLLQLEQA